MPNPKLTSVPDLQSMAGRITPVVAAAGEVIPWVWYDTANYVSGTSTVLQFFTQIQSDKVKGNMAAASQIPAPMYFLTFHLGVYPIIAPQKIENVTVPAAGTANDVGPILDMHNLLVGSLELDIAQKQYWRSPIFLCPPGGGPAFCEAIAGTFAAPASRALEVAYHGVPDVRNKNNWWGMIIIPPNQEWFVQLAWSAAITLNAGNSDLRVFNEGYLVRRVL